MSMQTLFRVAFTVNRGTVTADSAGGIVRTWGVVGTFQGMVVFHGSDRGKNIFHRESEESELQVLTYADPGCQIDDVLSWAGADLVVVGPARTMDSPDAGHGGYKTVWVLDCRLMSPAS